jgi:hypothetical protein
MCDVAEMKKELVLAGVVSSSPEVSPLVTKV